MPFGPPFTNSLGWVVAENCGAKPKRARPNHAEKSRLLSRPGLTWSAFFDRRNTMISLSRMGMIRAASLAVMLALAAVVMRPLVLPLAAQVWTLDATVADGTDPAEHGVRPAKTVLRVI